MATVVGVDPGSDRFGMAVVKDGVPIGVRAIKIKSRKSAARSIKELVAPMEMFFEDAGDSVDLIVVEGQHYHHSSPAAPEHIIKLAQIAGGFAGLCAALSTAQLVMPEPDEWKGQTKKPINQGRTFNHYGISYTRGKDYCWPTGCAVATRIAGYGQLNRGDWKEVGDALGLARYGEAQLGS